MRMTTRIALSNMKYYKSKNILIGIAIFLTTLLLFLVPTIGMDMVKMQYALVNEVYPAWHALFRDVDEDTVTRLAAHHDLAEYGLRSDVGMVADDEKKITLLYLDAKGCELYRMKLSEGELPGAENEIAVSKGMLEALGVQADIGDTVPLPVQIYRGGGLDYAEKMEFVITGFVSDGDGSEEQGSFTALVSKEFLQAQVPEQEISYRFLFQVGTSQNTTTDEIEEIIYKIASQYGIEEDEIRINTDYLGANYVDPTTVPVIVGIMCIIVLAGVITIYSIYYVGIPGRVREFGRIRAVGASRRQLKSIVLKEGLAVAALAIPLGLLAGTLLVRPVIFAATHIYVGENAMLDVIVRLIEEGKVTLFSFPLYLVAAAVTVAAVWVSLKKPMRIVGKVSEMEAIRYENKEDAAGKKARRKSLAELTVFRLAKIHLLGNKKSAVLTIGAMSATGIFIMVVATVLSCANPEESADNSIYGHYAITPVIEFDNKEHPEREWSEVTKNNPLTEELKEKIEQVEGIRQVLVRKEIFFTSPQLADDRWTMGGLPEACREELLDGIIEGEASWEDLERGDKAIADWTLLYWCPDVKVGDKIQITVLDGKNAAAREVEIIAIGDYGVGFSAYNSLLMADSGIEKICPGQTNGTFHVFAEKKYEEGTAEALVKLLGDDGRLEMDTWKAQFETWSSGIALTSAGCYAFLGILGAICVMNMINTMIHSVHLRKREIGMMQAMGMSDGQLVAMLQMEGLFYTLGTLVLSVGGGSLLGYPVFLWAKRNGMFSIRYYHYPLEAAVIVALILLLIQMLLAFMLGRSVRKQSLIERVRYSE